MFLCDCSIKLSQSDGSEGSQYMFSWRNRKIFSKLFLLLYFFGYKMDFFFFQNNPKDLDPSCKTDLDLLDCLGRVNLVL